MTMFASSTLRQEVAVSLDGYIRLAKAAKRLRVSVKTMYRWIEKGRFPGATKLDPLGRNSPYLIPIKDIEEIEKMRKPPTDRQ